MNNRKKKIIIASLLGMVVCLGIGFAAFSTTLKINGSAKVSPNGENYKVVFASEVKSDGTYFKNDIEGETNPDVLETTAGKFTSDTTFENESVTFTEDNQKATFTFYLYNAGKYDAHINGIEIGNKTCELIEGSTATEALVNEACEDIKMTVSLGEGENKLVFDQSQSIEDYVLNKGDKRLVVVTMEYLEGGALADGDFKVNFGNVEIKTAATRKLESEPSQDEERIIPLSDTITAKVKGNVLTISGTGEYDIDRHVLFSKLFSFFDLVDQSINNFESGDWNYNDLLYVASWGCFDDGDDIDYYISQFTFWYENGTVEEFGDWVNVFGDKNVDTVIGELNDILNSMKSEYKIDTLIVEDGITSILNLNNLGLKKVVLSSSVVSLGKDAFWGNDIVDLTLKGNDIYINDDAFGGNCNLTLDKITIDGSDYNLNNFPLPKPKSCGLED